MRDRACRDRVGNPGGAGGLTVRRMDHTTHHMEPSCTPLPVHPRSPFRPRTADLLAIFVLAVGITVRIVLAWAGRVSTDVDQSVVGLMARHMAQGSDFPVFFYGQNYMGSLEPVASALMFRLFGESGFVLGLGPVLFGCIALWTLWRWGRDAAGPWGGLLALLGGVFGPLEHFRFQAAARGGYMVALVVEILALMLSGRMAAAMREERSPRAWTWAELGLLAGVGLWSNPITAPALVVSALLLAWGTRWRPWRYWRGVLAAAGGMLSGLLPWIGYLARAGGMDTSVPEGVILTLPETLRCLRDNYLLFLSGRGFYRPLFLTHAWVTAGLALFGAWLVFHKRRETPLPQNAARAGAAMLVPLFAAVYGFSSLPSISTGRYWIPLAPALALLVALACVLPRHRAVRAAAFAAWMVLFALQAHLAVSYLRFASSRSVFLASQLETDLAGLRAAGVHEALMPLPRYTLNYQSGETVAVSDGRKCFYRPHILAIELAESPFYSADFPGIRSWLRLTGAECTEVSAGQYTLFGSLRAALPPDRELPVVPHAAGEPDAPLGILADGRSDTWWSVSRGTPATLEWELPGNEPLTSLRLRFNHRVDSPWVAAATGARIEIPSPDGGWTVWKEVEFHSLETSLGRPYPSYSPDALEIPLGGIRPERLRTTLFVGNPDSIHKPWQLAEAILYEAIPGDTSDRADTLLAAEAPATLARWLESRPGLWLFAPRRLSGILVSRHGVAPDRLGGLPAVAFDTSPAAAGEGWISPDRPVALCVEPRMLPAAERALRAACRTWSVEEVGPWRILVPEPAPAPAFTLIWDGDAPLAALDMDAVDRRVDAILREFAAGRNDHDAVCELAAIRPEALAAIPEEAVWAVGGEALSALRAERGCIPAHPCEATFADGLRLRGVDVSPANPHPGDALSVILYWQATGKPHPDGPETTFIHVCDASGRVVAQADWFGVANVPRRPDFGRPLCELQPERRVISLPSNLPPGPLQLRIGRSRPGWRWRVPVTSPSLPVSRRALLLDIFPS